MFSTGWMYELNQSYNPAFFMAGAFTTLGVCLLFLVPILLPPEVKEEWINRKNGYLTRLETSTSGESSGLRTKSSLSVSDPELNQNKTLAVRKLNEINSDPELSVSGIQKSGSAISLSYILEKYLSMPKLTSQQDAVLGNIYNSEENFWIPLYASLRETDV